MKEKDTTSITPGPFRPASNLGVFVTMVSFEDILKLRESLRDYETMVRRTIENVCLGSYTFRFDCELTRDDEGQVGMVFNVFLASGNWDDYVEWPFAKKVTAILTHIKDQDKDIRLPIRMTNPKVIKKPAPGKSNWFGNESIKVSWQRVELNGFIVNDTLYVNIEFE
ncbi:hypothetical protein MTO96_029998 [Rhipicephalus appendiculatus]